MEKALKAVWADSKDVHPPQHVIFDCFMVYDGVNCKRIVGHENIPEYIRSLNLKDDAHIYVEHVVEWMNHKAGDFK